MNDVQVLAGDCLTHLAALPDGSVDAVVTDPPYGLEFMGREWDTFKPSAARIRERVDGRTNPASGKSTTRTPEAYVAGSTFQRWCEAWAGECLRVLKPGGYLAAFGGTRTYHRLACAIEDAGFEIRDSLHWLYGSGFPKSLDVGKAIDKAAGAHREVVGSKAGQPGYSLAENHAGGRQAYGEWTDAASECAVTAPATAAAAEWDGWGTALKPAHEPIVLARKPLVGTVAANVVEHGTGALNIAGCLVASGDPLVRPAVPRADNDVFGPGLGAGAQAEPGGRWPANVLLTHDPACQPAGTRNVRASGHHPAARGPGGVSTSGHTGQAGLTERRAGTETVAAWDCVPGCPVAELDRQSGTLTSGKLLPHHADSGKLAGTLGAFAGASGRESYGDSGGASRFFPVFRYQAKAPKSERPRIEGVPPHPTVKPVALMRWLVRLVTPPGGLVVDPFAGTGTTGEACLIEGFRCVLIEQDPGNIQLIGVRLARPVQAELG